jgi:hypothetical protein
MALAAARRGFCRRAFIAALTADPPAAILLTNSQWPLTSGFEAVDGWPEFASLLRSGYVLDGTGSAGAIAWRLYLRRTPPDAAQMDGLTAARAMSAAQSAETAKAIDTVNIAPAEAEERYAILEHNQPWRRDSNQPASGKPGALRRRAALPIRWRGSSRCSNHTQC